MDGGMTKIFFYNQKTNNLVKCNNFPGERLKTNKRIRSWCMENIF